MSFEELWQLLYDHGASAKKYEGTKNYWLTLTPQQREQVSASISSKLAAGKFVQYDPIRAIRENTPKNTEPTNYNGKALPDEPVVIARWNGVWGTYTESDVRKYHMETRT